MGGYELLDANEVVPSSSSSSLLLSFLELSDTHVYEPETRALAGCGSTDGWGVNRDGWWCRGGRPARVLAGSTRAINVVFFFFFITLEPRVE